MTSSATQWECHPKAEALVQIILDKAIKRSPFIAQLQNSLLKQTSTRLFDWVDHVVIDFSPDIEQQLKEVGFVLLSTMPKKQVFHHPGAQLPMMVLQEDMASDVGVAVFVERIADFLMVRGLSREIEGSCLSPYRRCTVVTENGATLWVVERHGARVFEPIYEPAEELERYLMAEEKWMTRPRHLENEQQAMAGTLQLAHELVKEIGQDEAACLVLECERRFWESRNVAGQLQKNRQDRLGMGWANHDHHTFRSSRRHFPQLVHLFEILGFYCRERFYAGKDAGWGAQVMENPHCRLVLFLDLDLSPHELEGDFAHHPLPELPKMGTVGLWCALHGDSILQSGMHHLEAQFMFDELTKDLAHLGVGMMDPFSKFSYLRQAFTQGEVWQVDPQRVRKLLDQRLISSEQAEKFLKYGAVGSHLENLQRREGYKGFNQNNVSHIIRKTDPRNYD